MGRRASPFDIILGINNESNTAYQSVIDAKGNTYIVGGARSALFGEIKTDSFLGGFLAKYGPDGTFLWGVQLNTPGVDISIKSLDLNGGYVYALGETTGAVAGVAVPDLRDGFIAKFFIDSGIMAPKWPKIIHAHTPGAHSVLSVSKIKFDTKNMAHIIGYSNFGVGFGAQSGAKIGVIDGYILDVTTTGVPAGSIFMIGKPCDDSYVMPTGLAIDAANNLYLSGRTTVSVFQKKIVGWSDGFLAKYRLYPHKKLLWGISIGAKEADTIATSVVLSPKGGFGYVGGYMTASAKPSARGSFAGSRRGYVAAFDAAYGLWRWVKNSSITTGRDEAIAVTADPQGNAVVVGYTDQVVGTQHTYTFCDATIVKYSPTGVKLWSSQLGDGTKYSTAVYWSVVAFKTEIFAVGTSSFGVDPTHPYSSSRGNFAISKVYQPCDCNTSSSAGTCD